MVSFQVGPGAIQARDDSYRREEHLKAPDSSAGGQFVEQLILALVQLGDRCEHMGAMGRHRIGMFLRLSVLGPSAGTFGDERSDAQVVGLVGEVGELLVDHCELLTQCSQPCRCLTEPTFDGALPHVGECTEGR
ncbi:MAG: hypothetical protein RLZZ623_2984 [Actinomycetota bacterium]